MSLHVQYGMVSYGTLQYSSVVSMLAYMIVDSDQVSDPVVEPYSSFYWYRSEAMIAVIAVIAVIPSPLRSF